MNINEGAQGVMNSDYLTRLLRQLEKREWVFEDHHDLHRCDTCGAVYPDVVFKIRQAQHKPGCEFRHILDETRQIMARRGILESRRPGGGT